MGALSDGSDRPPQRHHEQQEHAERHHQDRWGSAIAENPLQGLEPRPGRHHNHCGPNRCGQKGLEHPNTQSDQTNNQNSCQSVAC